MIASRDRFDGARAPTADPVDDTAGHAAETPGTADAGADLAAVVRELRTIRTLLAQQSAELLSAAAVSRLLGIGEASLYRLKSAGKLPAPIRLGGSSALVRWRRADLMQYLQDQRPAK